MSRSDHDKALARIAEAQETQAKILDLGDLQLDGLPKKLGELTGLCELALGWRAVSQDDGDLVWGWCGERPRQRFTDLDVLKPLVNLRTLSLGGCNSLTDVSVLAGLTNLHTLDLGGCKSLTDVSVLAKLPNLHWLHLGECKSLTDVSVLAGLTNLHTLYLGWCEELTDVSRLAGLTNLSTLSLGECKSLTDVSVLAGLTNLHWLHLGECKSLTDVSVLAGLTNLYTLYLGWCEELTDVSMLAGLTNLRTLELGECKSLRDVSVLAKLPNLHTLDLDGCKSLTDVSVLAKLPNLHTLDLGYCKSLRDVSVLGGLTNLRTLSLLRCGDLGSFDSLRPLLPNLVSLNLYGCSFYDLPTDMCQKWEGEDILNNLNTLQAKTRKRAPGRKKTTKKPLALDEENGLKEEDIAARSDGDAAGSTTVVLMEEIAPREILSEEERRDVREAARKARERGIDPLEAAIAIVDEVASQLPQEQRQFFTAKVQKLLRPKVEEAGQGSTVSSPLEHLETLAARSEEISPRERSGLKKQITTLVRQILEEHVPDDYQGKQRMATRFNRAMMDLRYALVHPRTGEAASLGATRGRATDAKGYLLVYQRKKDAGGKQHKTAVPDVVSVMEVPYSARKPNSFPENPGQQR